MTADETTFEQNEDHDLYCLQCGYNLRGLSGDPRRCPECGHVNALGSAGIPPERIKAQLRRMKTTPTMCVVCALLFLAFATASLTFAFRPQASRNSLVCTSSSAIIAALFWLGCADQFKWSCQGLPGWSRLLFKLHVVGFGFAAVIVASALGLYRTIDWAVCRWIMDEHDGSFSHCTFLVAVVTLVFVLFLIARRMTRGLMMDMDQMQRELAARIVRQKLYRRLARRR